MNLNINYVNTHGNIMNKWSQSVCTMKATMPMLGATINLDSRLRPDTGSRIGTQLGRAKVMDEKWQKDGWMDESVDEGGGALSS